jgi:predicted Zn-dependent protease
MPLPTGAITRREFLTLGSISALSLAAGCATNPVTGQSQLMLVSESQEVQIDRQHSPHQFSADYGVSQDRQLVRYVDQTGRRMAAQTHRPQMPYTFKVVNATYVNAYAFPGGSIAATRGILLELDNEAELASLLGHELGHVNARHTAEHMSKGILTQAIVGGVAAYAGTQGQGYGQLAAMLGMVGAGALLASYSRDNEREADDLGLSYMVRSGYHPDGFVGLMDMLNGMSKSKPNAFEMLFATHPMSAERYQTAVQAAGARKAEAGGNRLHRERYMDHTAGLRAIKPAIQAMQNGEKQMARKNLTGAEREFRQALRLAPDDYAGLVLMSKCLMAQKKFGEAERYAKAAQQRYPGEAQALHITGYTHLIRKNYAGAYQDFSAVDRHLPGNPKVTFFKGYALEGMGQRTQAGYEYRRYLQSVQQGEEARHAYQQLVRWGMLPRQ